LQSGEVALRRTNSRIVLTEQQSSNLYGDLLNRHAAGMLTTVASKINVSFLTILKISCGNAPVERQHL
jgi:hypothetical protein